MYVWRRSATQQWWFENSARLELVAGDQIAIIERPNRKRLQIEVAAKNRKSIDDLMPKFGGRIHSLPPHWFKQLQRGQKARPIRIGKSKLIIPAGSAFGTGEHATTAMCLRFLEQVASDLPPQWTMIDLGTGSGILALAAKRLGAKRVIAIDNDPTAISTAQRNARRNRIANVTFQISDATRRRFPPRIDMVTANLFSELLITILPRIGHAKWLILSGILRQQEAGVLRAVRRNKASVVDVRRRGKWVAILAKTGFAHRHRDS